MRLVTYDRGGARRLGAWVGDTVVDLPDAVGHPAFPSTMETLLVRGSVSLLEAARAALELPDVLEEAGVRRPRLLPALVPRAVHRVSLVPALRGRSAGAAAQQTGTSTRRAQPVRVDIGCLLGRSGRRPRAGAPAMSILGYALATPGDPIGPSVVTSDELDRVLPKLVVTLGGRAWMETLLDPAMLDPRALAREATARSGRVEDLRPGDLLVARLAAAPVREGTDGESGSRPRASSKRILDLEGEPGDLLRRASASS